MANPHSIRQSLLDLQATAGCERFDDGLKRVLEEWKRALEEWERQATFVKDMVAPSHSLSTQCKGVVHLLSKSFREILIFHYLQRQFLRRRVALPAIVEYCADFQRNVRSTFVDANDRLLQCYNDLVMGKTSRAENSAQFVRNSYEACYELLRRANDRLSNVLRQHLNNRRIVTAVACFGGNFVLWSVGTFVSRYFSMKFPSKFLLFGTALSASVWSYYSLKSADPYLMYQQENPSFKELDDFILNL